MLSFPCQTMSEKAKNWSAGYLWVKDIEYDIKIWNWPKPHQLFIHDDTLSFPCQTTPEKNKNGSAGYLWVEKIEYDIKIWNWPKPHQLFIHDDTLSFLCHDTTDGRPFLYYLKKKWKEKDAMRSVLWAYEICIYIITQRDFTWVFW